jgi:hypothetical protein
MTFATQSPRGAWWKQLSDHIHSRTNQQLRRLQIRMSGGRIMIRGRVPSEEVRRCAEEAALEVVPEKFLALRLSIDGEPEPVETTRPVGKSEGREADVNPLVDMVLYRRLYNLVAGN